ncbi:hypothetical protein ACFV4T_12335 [Streptomyces sp. NPDC059755]|uniref:hypothetical protein n=1 Tax=Streptomyces sp. NPDC059755 TaxID=3346934 RepID=UPI003650E133
MNGQPWTVRLSPQAAKVLTELPAPAKEMVRDVLDIAVRSPWGWPQWNAGDPEGEDVRAVSIGQLSVVYVINRLTRSLSVLDVVWKPPVSMPRLTPAMLWPVRASSTAGYSERSRYSRPSGAR